MITPQNKQSAQIQKPNFPIYAYMRRSTKKDDQADSLEKQFDSIDAIVQSMGLKIDDITESFWDTFTGYKIKTDNGRPIVKRKGFKEMIQKIKSSRERCIILAFNPSRLTRNVPDGTTIKELLGHYGNKQKVEYIRFYDGSIWNFNTLGTTIDAEVAKANAYSERLAKDKEANNMVALNKGIMPKTIKTPHGLKASINGVIETEKMPFIVRVFEMKAEGRNGKEISNYLMQNGIKIKEGNLANSIFKKELYIGEYYHKKSQKHYNSLKFVKGKPPISRVLWDRVQKRLGVKGGGYGEKQEGDKIGKLIKWDDDRSKIFSIDRKRGETLNYYKNNAYGGSIRETMIFKEYTDKIIPEVLGLMHYLYRKGIVKDMWGKDITYKEYGKRYFLDLRYRYILSTNNLATKEELLRAYNNDYCYILRNGEKITDENISEISQRIIIYEIERFLKWHESETDILNIETGENINQSNREKVLETIRNALLEGKNKEILETEKINKNSQKTELRKKLSELNEIVLSVSEKYALGEIEKTIYEQIIEKRKSEISAIELAIESLGEFTSLEEYINTLPKILSKIFELSSKHYSEWKRKDIREELTQLIEIITFELEVNTKKELKIKLFEGLQSLIDLNGGGYRIRTYDPLLVRQML